jgi:hypothetical protein
LVENTLSFPNLIFSWQYSKVLWQRDHIPFRKQKIVSLNFKEKKRVGFLAADGLIRVSMHS